MKGPLAGLMQQAQRMQQDMQRAQEELAQLEVTGQAGGGLVSVVMSGRHEVRRVSVERQSLADDAEMGEGVLAAAFNDAINKVATVSQERMSGLTNGLNLPPGFKMPF